MKIQMAVLARENMGGCELVRVGYRPAEPEIGGTSFWDNALGSKIMQDAIRLVEQEITREETSQGTYRRLLAVRDEIAASD